MKKILSISIFLFSLTLNAQWKEQFSKINFNPSNVFFINSETGWVTATTDLIEIYKTNNSGINWTLCSKIQDNAVTKIQFIDELTGYLTSLKSLYKTTDGGITWNKIYTLEEIRDFQFINSTGWLLGKNEIYLTINSGTSWQQRLNNFYYSNAVYFKDIFQGWVFDPWGTSTSNSFFSTDGGLTWNSQTHALKSIFFINDKEGWAGTLTKQFLHTTDGGRNWTVIAQDIDIFKMQFINQNIGWIWRSDESYNSTINMTTDGGLSWKYVNTYISETTKNFQLRGFYFIDNNNGWLIGQSYIESSWIGSILKFDNNKKLHILTPGNGDKIYTKNLVDIKWSHSYLDKERAKLEFSSDLGSNWSLIADSVQVSDLIYSWKVPYINSSNQCLIRMTAYSSNIIGISVSPFQIIQETRQLSILFPKANEVFQSTQEITIKWDANYNSSSNLVVEFIPSQMYMTWEVPINNKSLTRSLPYYQSQYRIKISDKDNPNIMDVTDLFWVKYPPSIKIISPNGKESWQKDSIKVIKVAFTNIDKINLEFSTNSGISWTNLAKNIPADSNSLGTTLEYKWKIPNMISKACKVRANSAKDPALYDDSDADFEIIDKQSSAIFPLEVGNIWFYGAGGFNKNNYIVLEVLKDTILQDNFKYYKVSRNGFNNYLSNSDLSPTEFYLRQQGNVLYYKNNEQTISKKLIDFSNPYQQIKTLFGKNLRSYAFEVQDYVYASITDSIGYSTYYSFNNGRGTKFSYELFYCIIDGIKYGNDLTDVDDNLQIILPNQFQLSQNYPNPFNPSTTIKYSIPFVETHHGASLRVTLKVYDMLGREVATLVNEEKQPGTYEVTFNASHAELDRRDGYGRSMASGVYFYTLRSGDFIQTKKFVLMK